jgi:HEAT repeat protein
MSWDDFEERTWPGRLVRLCGTTVLVVAAVWLLINRERFWPPPITAKQRLAVLRDPAQSHSARRIAADNLQHAEASVVPELIQELQHGDSLGREVAALALGRLGTKAGEAGDALTSAVHDPDVNVRRQATIALGRITSRPEAAIAGLLVGLRDTNDSVREEAFTALRRHAAGARELAHLLTDADADIRRRAAIALGQMEYEVDGLADDLRTALADADPRVRAETYAALAKHDGIDASGLITAMKDDADPLVRRTAVTLLTRDPDARAETLVPALADADRQVRLTALAALGDMREEAEPAVLAIAAQLDGSDEETARRALFTLAQIGPAARGAAGTLMAHHDDPRDSVRGIIFSILQKISPESELRLPELFDSLQADGEKVRSLSLWKTIVGAVPGQPTYSNCGFGITDADMAHLSGLRNLEWLDLEYNPVGDAGLAQIASLSKLKRLNLSDTRVTSAGLIHLAGLANLQSLSLSRCAVGDDGLDHLKDLHELKSLVLHDTLVTDAGMRCLAGLSKLKSLSLGGTEVTDAGLAHLKGLSSLEVVYFGEHQFSPRGLSQLAGLSELRCTSKSIADGDLAALEPLSRLRKLLLVHTSITDAGLEALGKLASLETLCLDETSITDAGLAHLTGLKKLRLLTVGKTRVTQHGAEELKTSLPEVEVRPFFGRPTVPRGYEVVGLKKTIDGR